MKLAVIDLDMVVANNEARFEQAKFMRGYWHALLTDKLAKALANPTNLAQVEKGLDELLENLFWQTAFTPELVALDTLIPGVNQALMDIQQQGYKVVFLTSRPDSMRGATVQWLFEHTVYDADDELVTKAAAFQYTKTTVWKAGMVQTLAALYGASEVLFIDDENANAEAALNAWDNDKVRLWTSPSLELSVK